MFLAAVPEATLADGRGGTSSNASRFMENNSSYIGNLNITNTSWDDAQLSMIIVLGQQCRLQTASAFESSASLMMG